jgi:glycerophosphoryl diester phosphodiesterase
MRLPIIVSRPFRVIAHRGASAYAPENTRAAFRLAVAMGVEDIELDVQLSLDHEVVVCHDPTLERYGHPGRIDALNWPQLAQLDMGSWFSPYLFHGEKLLRLRDLFESYGSKITYHIELKGASARLPDHVCRLIDDFDLRGRAVITSFSYAALQQVKAISPSLRSGWLIRNIDAEALAKAGALALFQLCPRADLLTEETVRLAHGRVSEVRAWGIRGNRGEVLALIQKILDTGCDGATLDWPDWISHSA